jgi:heat shock protein HtpX
MLYQQILQNKRKTILLIMLFSVIVLVIGWAVGYLFNGTPTSGIIITLIILAFYVPITYMTANSQVLRMAGAKQITSADYPELYDVVEELSIAARIPVPDVYVVNDPAPNAFATGIKPEKGSVAFTTGLLEKLNREELSGVAAHEISHIRNYDIRLMTICIALVGVIVLIAHFGSRMLFFGGGRRGGDRKSNPVLMIIALVFIILAPVAAQFVQLAVSRNREYLADASAVDLTRNPTGLINALTKISQDPKDVENAQRATASMYIAVPLGRKRRKQKSSLWATHPSMESRINRLKNM